MSEPHTISQYSYTQTWRIMNVCISYTVVGNGVLVGWEGFEGVKSTHIPAAEYIPWLHSIMGIPTMGTNRTVNCTHAKQQLH